jgi:hypothetical protein
VTYEPKCWLFWVTRQFSLPEKGVLGVSVETHVCVEPKGHTTNHICTDEDGVKDGVTLELGREPILIGGGRP